MESNEFDGAFKKKPPPRAPRRRQPVADEDPDSSVRPIHFNTNCCSLACSTCLHFLTHCMCYTIGSNGRSERRQEVWMG